MALLEFDDERGQPRQDQGDRRRRWRRQRRQHDDRVAPRRRRVHRRQHRRAGARGQPGADEDPARRRAHQGPRRRRQPRDRPQGRARGRARSSTEVLAGADMVFVTAGMGGGTGTGAAPIIAQLAREGGALTVGVVTKPFGFEGQQARAPGREGIATLAAARRHADHDPERAPARARRRSRPRCVDAFRKADEVLLQAVQGISDLITDPRPHQRRLRRRAHDHDGHGPRAHGHRRRASGERRAHRGRRDGDHLAAARGRLDRRARPASSSTSSAAPT